MWGVFFSHSHFWWLTYRKQTGNTKSSTTCIRAYEPYEPSYQHSLDIGGIMMIWFEREGASGHLLGRGIYWSKCSSWPERITNMKPSASVLHLAGFAGSVPKSTGQGWRWNNTSIQTNIRYTKHQTWHIFFCLVWSLFLLLQFKLINQIAYSPPHPEQCQQHIPALLDHL